MASKLVPGVGRILRRRLSQVFQLRDFSVAFQRRKPEKIGIKAPLPGFIEPALASKVERVPEGTR